MAKIQNPNNSRKGRPVIPAMQVNAVDETGNKSLSISRNQWGVLMGTDSKGRVFHVREDAFHKFLQVQKRQNMDKNSIRGKN